MLSIWTDQHFCRLIRFKVVSKSNGHFHPMKRVNVAMFCLQCYKIEDNVGHKSTKTAILVKVPLTHYQTTKF